MRRPHQKQLFTSGLLRAPFLKESEDQEWWEAFATIRKTSLDKMLQLSGKHGIFTKPFLTKDGSHFEKLKVVWLENGITLDDPKRCALKELPKAWPRAEEVLECVYPMKNSKKSW